MGGTLRKNRTLPTQHFSMQSLVFVDQPEVAKLLMVALREAGFESTVVDDASCLVNTFGAQEHPALIVTSWGLSSLDGLAVCRQFREANPGRDTLVLILTGRMSPAELQAILDAGADDYVPFPIDPGVLHIRLRIISCRAQSRIKAVGVEQQLRQSVERFELAVAGARDGLWDSHPNGRPWNDPQNAAWHSARLKQSLGYSDEEFPPVIHSFTSRLHPDDKERVLNAMMEYIEHKQPYDIEYRLRAKSGEYIWFSARGQGVWDEQGRLMRMSGSLRDITQAKEYESKLEQSEARWRSLVENAPDIIILTDLEGTIQFINRDKSERQLGLRLHPGAILGTDQKSVCGIACHGSTAAL
jgi:PAS domain S-box-containing protein